MADRPTDDVLSGGDPDDAPRLVMSRGASVVSTAVIVQLLLAGAVVEDRRSRDSAAPRARATPSPSPSPSRSPEQITAAQATSRKRVAVNTARFTAGQVCKDASAFLYEVVESTSDVVESVVDAHDPEDQSGIIVRVTLLPGGVSYTVVDEHGDCDG